MIYLSIGVISLVFIAGLFWGSFLNVVAYRIIHDQPFFAPRSVCPFCDRMIAWYDNIPVLSWLLLRARCRWCRHPISSLYPFIELTTAVAVTMLFLVFHPAFLLEPFIAYTLFFSCLIMATRTDLELMLIPQAFTLLPIFLGLLFSWMQWISITPVESLIGAFIGYAFLWLVAKGFKFFTAREGLGVGDMELLAMIGSFLGPVGVWITLMIGSISGTLLGALYLVIARKHRSTRIPFGPFLALGAAAFVIFHDSILRFLLS